MEPYGTLAQYGKYAIIKKHNAHIGAWAAEMALGVATVFWATWTDIEMRLPKGDEPFDDATGFEAMQTIGGIVSKAIEGNSAAMVDVLQAYQYKGWICGAVEQARRTNSLQFFLSAQEQIDARFHEADTVTVQADEAGWVNLPNQRAVEYAQDHAAEAVTNIDSTTRETIARIVQDGVTNGTSYDDVAKQIEKKFASFATPKPQEHIENRAVLVAVTELANAYCAGEYQVGDFLTGEGLEMMKIWQTVEDSRVSDGCRANQAAGWIRHGEAFPSGDQHPPRFPGCRCDFLEDILDEDALGRSYEEYESAWGSDGNPGNGAALGKENEIPIDQWGEYELDSEVDRLNDDENLQPSASDTSNASLLSLIRQRDQFFSGGAESIAALKAYTGDYCKYANDVLNGKKTLDSVRREKDRNIVSQIVDVLPKAIKEVTTEHDIVTHRFFSGRYWNDWEVGTTKVSNGLTSSSLSRAAAYEGFGTRTTNEAVFLVRKGDGVGIFIDGESEYPEEWEYLINSGTEMRLLKRETTKYGATKFYIEVGS